MSWICRALAQTCSSRYDACDYPELQTKHHYPALYPYVDVFGRKTEADRYSRDADHSIPRKAWKYSYALRLEWYARRRVSWLLGRHQ